MAIGKNIDEMLKKQNRSVSWLAKKCGIDRNYLYNYIYKDSSKFKKNMLVDISRALDVPLTYLLGIKDNKDDFIEWFNKTSFDFNLSKSKTGYDVYYRIVNDDETGFLHLGELTTLQFNTLETLTAVETEENIKKWINFDEILKKLSK